jgi:hypothetical protein
MHTSPEHSGKIDRVGSIIVYGMGNQEKVTNVLRISSNKMTFNAKLEPRHDCAVMPGTMALIPDIFP